MCTAIRLDNAAGKALAFAYDEHVANTLAAHTVILLVQSIKNCNTDCAESDTDSAQIESEDSLFKEMPATCPCPNAHTSPALIGLAYWHDVQCQA